MGRQKSTEYCVERVIPFPAHLIWETLDDPRHFGERDPYHTDFEFMGEQRKGLGTIFRLKHSYWPIFWFAPDHVKCTIVKPYEPQKKLRLREENEKTPWKSHVQEFVLTPAGPNCTLVRFAVSYRAIPLALFPLRFWARWLAQKRMKDKLREIEEACGRKSP